MKKKLILMLSSVFMVIALIATPVLADGIPGWLASFWMTDPLQTGVQWWRDTTNQNALAQYYYNTYPQWHIGDPNIPVTEVVPGVYVVRGIGKSNVVALVGTTEWVLIDSMDSPDNMQKALLFLRPYIGTRPLKALIYTSEDYAHYSGSSKVAPFYSIPVYASAEFIPALKARSAYPNFVLYNLRITGQMLPEDPDWRIGPITEFAAFPFHTPNQLISTETTLNLAGFNIKLVPVVSATDAGLMVWLPDYKVLIAGDTWSPSFPDIGPLTGPSRPVQDWVNALNAMLALNPDYMVTTHGPVISSNGEIQSILTNYCNTMQYVYNSTLALINQGLSAKDAAVLVHLPEPLASDPYLQQFIADVPSAVEGIYRQDVGWFNGQPPELASSLTTARRTEIMLELGYEIEHMLGVARNAELTANDLQSAEKALLMTWATYQKAPGNLLANGIYIQALKKNAYMQRSNQIRNYYLSVAKEVERTMPTDTTPPVVTPPLDKTAEATGPLTSVAIGTAAATDDVGVVSITNDAPSGFSVGVTTVTWTATDAAGNKGTATQKVTVTVIGAKVNIDPNTMNLKSQGAQNSFTAYIELPSGYDVGLINVASVKLSVNGVSIAAQLTPTSVGDYDGDKVPDRMVKFDRQAVIKALAEKTGDIVMIVTGQLTDGHAFTGSDTIKVTNPGK